jgi:uncharacterized BrkB/YihY/UPF0761 family membrane protein
VVKLTVHYLRSTSFAVLTISLMGVIALLAVLLQRVLASAHAVGPDQAAKAAYLSRLAWLVGLVLLLPAALLAAVVIRYILARAANPPEPFKPMGHVDSWTEAGKRLKAENAPPVAPYDTPGPAPREKPDE